MPAEFVGDPALSIRALSIDHDVPLLHRWFTLDYARFWGMQGHTTAQVHAAYRALVDSGHARAWIGLHEGRPSFLFESYDPAHEELGEHYAVQPGDLGMHFFAGPPHGARIPDFTRRALRTVLGFMFGRLRAQRIVVEPDLRNDKVRALNRELGFVHQREVQLRDKRADLAWCTLHDFITATARHSPEEPNV